MQIWNTPERDWRHGISAEAALRRREYNLSGYALWTDTEGGVLRRLAQAAKLARNWGDGRVGDCANLVQEPRGAAIRYHLLRRPHSHLSITLP